MDTNDFLYLCIVIEIVMKYMTLFLISFVFCGINIAAGQTPDIEGKSSFEADGHDKVEWLRKVVSGFKDETSLSSVRFERLDEYILDKYTGEVSFLQFVFGKPERIMVKTTEKSRTDTACKETVNYQLMVDRKSKCYYLMNINSGDIWYIRNRDTKKACLQYLPAVKK